MGRGYFRSNNSGNTSLSTAYTMITLVLGGDTRSTAGTLPGGAHLWHVELDLNTAAGGAANLVDAVLTYDSGGLYNCAGPSGNNKLGNVTGTLYKASIYINSAWYPPTVAFTEPPTTSTDRVYLWLKLDAGTANLSANGARLQYTDLPNG